MISPTCPGLAEVEDDVDVSAFGRDAFLHLFLAYELEGLSLK
jgi:hypothetical protein